jgi:hypothetical protein
MLRIFLIFIYILMAGIFVVGYWKMYQKAGQPGWSVLVPIYNLYILTKIAGVPSWHLLLMLIPLVQLYSYAVICNGVSKNFEQGSGFAVGLFFLNAFFAAILGYGDATYSPAGSRPMPS